MSDLESTIQTPSIEQIKQRMRATWMAGDFGVIARTVSAAAEAFAARLPITPGQRVLDVATGTGNLALPIARRGAIVTGVDIAPNLLEQARARAAAERLKVTFDEGDAEQLPYADASFDAAVTIFGAMFAPRPELVASEFARVLRPGGLLAMGNWNPGSFSDKIFRAGAQYAPPPPGLEPPILWGDETTVRRRLEPFFEDIQTEIILMESDVPASPAGAVQLFRTYFGPTQMAFNRLDQSGQQALAADLEALWSEANISPNPAEHTLIKNQYLQVSARRKA